MGRAVITRPLSPWFPRGSQSVAPRRGRERGGAWSQLWADCSKKGKGPRTGKSGALAAGSVVLPARAAWGSHLAWLSPFPTTHPFRGRGGRSDRAKAP